MKKALIIFVFIFLLLFVSCNKKISDNNSDSKLDTNSEISDNEEDKPDIPKDEIYYNIIFTGFNGEVLKEERVKEKSSATPPDVPVIKYYTFSSWDKDYTSVSSDMIINAVYELTNDTFLINYDVDDNYLSYQSKEELVYGFLNDFYDFVKPKESKVAFLYGINDSDPSYSNYFGGSLSNQNYLIKDNNLDLDDDAYFFNSSLYKNKWIKLGEYVRDNVCKLNQRFGYPSVTYTHGALDFKRYITSDPDKYLSTYGGEESFYGFPKITIDLPKEYKAGKSLELPNLFSLYFTGWELDGSIISSIPSDILGDVTLKASFTDIIKYRVSFNTGTDIKIDDLIISSGDSVNLPNITFSNWEFLGWYLDYNKQDDELIFNYNTSITLNARWYKPDEVNYSFLTYNDKVITYKGDLVAVEIPDRYEEHDEMRAAWVSSMIGSFSPTYEKEIMKDELTKVLDLFSLYHMNTMIFHLRTHNNAFYQTKLAPIKEEYGDYESFNDFDYLAWLIDECHKRNIEFHAWLNPYRINLSGLDTNITKEDIALRYKNYPLNPASDPANILITYSDENSRGAILNPAKESVINHVRLVVLELLCRYDIDGIHFDDYFYQRLSFEKNLTLEDDQIDYEKYISESDTSYSIDNEKDKENWRRDNVNRLICLLHDDITKYNKENGKHVVFGISPTGVYKSGDGSKYGGSFTTSGGHYGRFTFSDSVKWIDEGWIDYIMPQCYTSFDNPSYYFQEITSWWNEVVRGTNVKLYIGIGLHKALDKTYTYSWHNEEDELINQLLYLNTLDNVCGVSLFSFTSFKTIYCDSNNISYNALIKLKDELWTETVKIK